MPERKKTKTTASVRFPKEVVIFNGDISVEASITDEDFQKILDVENTKVKPIHYSVILKNERGETIQLSGLRRFDWSFNTEE